MKYLFALTGAVGVVVIFALVVRTLAPLAALDF